MDLSGKELIKGETDGSSFPSGGCARPSSPRIYRLGLHFRGILKERCNRRNTLYPNRLLFLQRRSLDKKTPLLRSMQAIDKEATRIFHLSDTQK